MDALFSNVQNMFNNTDDKKTLLKDQQNKQQKINKILEQSYSALICGPSCQKEKITKELKQKYLDAQTNLKTAPDQLEKTKRNYVIYSQGESKYNAIQEEELKKIAEEISSNITTLFDDELTNAYTMNSYLETATTNSEYTEDLLEIYLKQNEDLMKQLKESQSDIVTNDRKTYYENEAIDNLSLWYILFWRSFYLVYIILFLTLLTMKKYGALVASVLLFFYPYYINQLSTFLFEKWTNLMHKMPSNIYNNL